MKLDYQAYEALFNTGDDEALVERFFAPTCRMVSANGVREGHGGLKAFLAWAHDGVREVMRPQRVLSDDGILFAEVDMDFHATKERTDFPFGHLFPGDLVTVKFFVTYTLDEAGRIVELKSMTWPPEKGVTRLPRLGAHPSQVAAFLSYGAAFSNADFERWPKFYTDDMVFSLHAFGIFKGRQAIVDFYLPVFAYLRETVEFERVEATDDHIRAVATSRFTALRDEAASVFGPLKQGDVILAPVIADYTLRGGLISRIEITRNGERVFIPAGETE
ncbi:MAG: nuclear transport factor 2 family protein [Candidatus Andeanibacterium colombiense]|uniref:Nuclear transport factor 2 family protein n=1 Tax=Candidatus Andeanibacterium colombiense TaxID=3121345 RepID=A0AAJ6BNM3_9SPHN|nr:MAG: nuclear transport factor 2 family protein [Sphingomonadaceae bacterium]